MQSTAWTVMAWKPVKASIRELHGLLGAMRPVSALLTNDRSNVGFAKGHALWGYESLRARYGIAWDWIETRNVIALADPMTILSNIKLVGEHGELLGENERILHLNNAVHELPWQQAVREATRSTALDTLGAM